MKKKYLVKLCKLIFAILWDMLEFSILQLSSCCLGSVSGHVKYSSQLEYSEISVIHSVLFEYNSFRGLNTFSVINSKLGLIEFIMDLSTLEIFSTDAL